MRTGQLSPCRLQNFTWVRGGAGGAGMETTQLLPPLHNLPSLCNPNLCSGRGECSLSTSLILYQAILSSSCQPYSLQKIPPLLLLSLQGAHIAPSNRNTGVFAGRHRQGGLLASSGWEGSSSPAAPILLGSVCRGRARAGAAGTAGPRLQPGDARSLRGSFT